MIAEKNIWARSRTKMLHVFKLPAEDFRTVIGPLCDLMILVPTDNFIILRHHTPATAAFFSQWCEPMYLRRNGEPRSIYTGKIEMAQNFS